jgi:hypothetical protein
MDISFGSATDYGDDDPRFHDGDAYLFTDDHGWTLEISPRSWFDGEREAIDPGNERDGVDGMSFPEPFEVCCDGHWLTVPVIGSSFPCPTCGSTFEQDSTVPGWSLKSEPVR